MNTRREPDKTSLERIGARVRQRALTGSEASTVGFTLVVFIFAGAGLGYLLDTYLETSYCIAIGTLFGAAVGFREMFRLTKKLTRSSALEDDEPTLGAVQAANTADSAPTIARSSQPVQKENFAQKAVGEEKSSRPRIFSVPPPPQASFDTSKREQAAPSSKPVESQEKLIERLLDDEEMNDENKEK